MTAKNNVALLVAGQSLANIGDILYIVTIINFVYILTGSAAVASVIPFTVTSAMFVSSLLTPLLTGRIGLNRLLAATQGLKTAMMAGFGLMLPLLNVSNYYFIFLVIALVALCDGCSNPVSQALIPHYVEPERLVKANGVFEGVYQTINTVMWLAGGAFLLFMDSGQLIWTVALLFLLSSVLLSLLDRVEHRAESESPSSGQQLKEGWITLFQVPVLKRVAVIELLETFAGAVWIAAILYVYVSDVLQAGQQWWGFINGTFFMGLILGGLLFVRFDEFADRHLAKVMFGGLAAGTAATALFGITAIPGAALALSFLVGLGVQLVGIPKQTIIQTSIPEDKLATVYSSLGALGTLTFGVASLLIGITAEWLGVKSVYLLSALLLAVAALIVFSSRKILSKGIQ
ncbi:MFS transporter [Bhargavaea beijingensis]|uniref:Major Facilitator Superfamily protein n=1 Tax=Bhargavaea beijingensis TaxID=426756 RepID=A0A1G7E6A2_9BACL|nr:MFS transporter [Bhargavaea beijingensis]MCW1927519.1 MFS transporter [Bhargavaea beijingensis]SDE59010.1 Major Facilitator Superfamily protein [Bhargavaea beijingensis]